LIPNLSRGHGRIIRAEPSDVLPAPCGIDEEGESKVRVIEQIGR
jgi:hypothetical protein